MIAVRYFEGWVDEVAVHARALNAKEVAEMVCYALPPKEGLSAHYRFNDASLGVTVANAANSSIAAAAQLVSSTSSVWEETTRMWTGQGLLGVPHPSYECVTLSLGCFK